MFEGFTGLLFLVVIVVGGLFAIGMILTRLYHRASKELAFVRTGFGGQKVIVDGGALVLPVLHEVIPVNMNTLRLEVRRANEQALITRDRMRVDVQAEFYVRVQPTRESIANAAQTLGLKTTAPDQLRELVEGKFVDALRAVAAEMAMEELHEQRVSFVQKVQTAVTEDLLKNGLELESVSLTGLDQTNREHFNPDNAFDAEGLTRLTYEIEEKRRRRNEIEQDTEVGIKEKNLEAERRRLTLERDEQFARLEQQQEIATRRAEQGAEVVRQEAERKRESEEARILSERQVRQANIAAERRVEEDNIARQRALEVAEIERRQAIELAEQVRAITIAEKSKEQSQAQAEADEARSLAVRAEEKVATVRDTEVAERRKAIELVEARQAAERDAIGITVAAEASKRAAEDDAEAVRTRANAEADRERIAAQAAADAERLRAAAAELTYQVEAAGRRALNEADNVLTPQVIALKTRLELLQQMPLIIEASVKPLEHIDGIKIIQVDGLTPRSGAAGSGAPDGQGSGSLADQIVTTALRYRSQAPLIDALLKDVGLDGASLSGLAGAATADAGRDAGADQEPPAQTGAGEAGGLEPAPPASAPPKPPAPRRRGGDKPDKTA